MFKEMPFLKINPKTEILLKNMFYSLGIKGLNIVISILTVPILINYLDTAQYGVWIVILSFTSWFTILDLGLGNGLKNKLVEFLAQNNLTSAQEYVSTTYIVMTTVCITVCLFLILISPFIPWFRIFNVREGLNAMVAVSTSVLLISTLLNMVLRLITNLLHAHQQSFFVDAVICITQIASFLSLLLARYFFEPSLIVVAVFFATSQFLTLIAINIWFFSKAFRDLRPSMGKFKKDLLKNTMNLGGRFFLLQISGLAMYMTDNFIIANLFGASEVVSDNISYKYFGTVLIAWGVVVTPLWPLITKSFYSDDFIWIKIMLKKMWIYMILTAIALIIMLLCSPYIYQVWVGEKVNISFNLNIFVLIYILVSAASNLISTFINAFGRIRLQMMITIVIALINVPLGYLLSKTLHMGVIGVPLATSICLIVMTSIGVIQVNKILNKRAEGIWFA